jgi:hypothetical protein
MSTAFCQEPPMRRADRLFDIRRELRGDFRNFRVDRILGS